MFSAVIGKPFANKDTKLLIDRKVVKRLCAEAREALPREYSALLAGTGNRVTLHIPAPLETGGPATFAWSGAFLVASLRRLHETGLAWLGVLHSHPQAPAIPSEADTAGWHYPSLGYWILSCGSEPCLRLYRMESGRFVPHDYLVID